jgi:hypothetical protein
MISVSADRPVAAARWQPARLARLDWALAMLPLAAILVLQAIASLSLSNTAFQDEALYLYAGHQVLTQLLGGTHASVEWANGFSGLPYIQPLIASVLAGFGGVEAARALSLACMLGTTSAVYYVTKQLFSRDAAVFAAALFAAQASVVFIGRLATYDAMALFLLGLGAVLALIAGSMPRPWLAPLVGAVLLLAIGTKFATGLWVPSVFCLLAWQSFRAGGWTRMFVRTGLAGVTLLGGAVEALRIMGPDLVHALTVTTTNRTAEQIAARSDLLLKGAQLGGALIVLAALGLLLNRRQGPIPYVFMASALLAVAYHVYSREGLSLQKHMAFSAFFAAPLAGCFVARLGGYGERESLGSRWLAGLAICTVLFGVGLQQARSLFNEWPDSTQVVQVLRTQVRPGVQRILAEDAEVPRYYLNSIVSYSQWSNTYWFQYRDHSGRLLTGAPAWRAAIADRYFDLVVLRYGPTYATDVAIDGGLKHGNGYQLLAKLPFNTSFGPGNFWVWRKT